MSIARFALLPQGGIGPLEITARDETLRARCDPIDMITGMDLIITINYHVGFVPLSRAVRFVASIPQEGELSCRPVPVSEPEIPNGTGEEIRLSGVKFEVTNNAPQDRR
jgi:hypothetical protein